MKPAPTASPCVGSTDMLAGSPHTSAWLSGTDWNRAGGTGGGICGGGCSCHGGNTGAGGIGAGGCIGAGGGTCVGGCTCAEALRGASGPLRATAARTSHDSRFDVFMGVSPVSPWRTHPRVPGRDGRGPRRSPRLPSHRKSPVTIPQGSRRGQTRPAHRARRRQASAEGHQLRTQSPGPLGVSAGADAVAGRECSDCEQLRAETVRAGGAVREVDAGRPGRPRTRGGSFRNRTPRCARLISPEVGKAVPRPETA